MSIKSWWNRLFWLKIESQFVNLRKPYGQPKYLQLDLILATRQKKNIYIYNSWLPFVYLLEPWKQTYMVGWFLAVGCVHLPFLHSLHLHHLFHILLDKSGSQQNRVLLLIRTRYEEDKVYLFPFKCLLTVRIVIYISDWKGQEWGNTVWIWNVLKFALILAAQMLCKC